MLCFSVSNYLLAFGCSKIVKEIENIFLTNGNDSSEISVSKINQSVSLLAISKSQRIIEIEDSKYDKIFVDLNDDQYCIDLARKNMKGLKRILKKGGIITAQVGSKDKKPKQVENWCKVLDKSFGNVKLSGAYIPSFDCNWNFASSIMK